VALDEEGRPRGYVTVDATSGTTTVVKKG